MRRIILTSINLMVAGMIIPFIGFELIKNWLVDIDPFDINTDD